VPKRLAILGVFLFALIAVVIVLPKLGQAPSAGAGVAGPPAIPAFKHTPPAPPTSAKVPAAAPPSSKHTITVKFDYDFRRSPVCSANITTKCVQQFNVYDISGGSQNRVKLFSVPVPAGASGRMKGITATSPQLVFEPGLHFLGVSARSVNGDESEPLMTQAPVLINP
jgi:hypothetical protein